MGFIKGTLKIAIGIVLAIVIIVVIIGAAASSKSGKATLREVHNDVAKDAIDQYEMAKRNGTKSEICVQAGFVAAAYLQAKNEPEYARWQTIKKTDCRAAGLPE